MYNVMDEKVQILNDALKWFLPKAHFFDHFSILNDIGQPKSHFLVVPSANDVFEKGKYFFKDARDCNKKSS